jgi:hypothetical protein
LPFVMWWARKLYLKESIWKENERMGIIGRKSQKHGKRLRRKDEEEKRKRNMNKNK